MKWADFEINEEELTALGLVLAMWRMQEYGTNSFSNVIAMGIAMMEVDDGVLKAHIDRICIRLSEIEEEVFGKVDKTDLVPEEIKHKRIQMNAHLDQVFASFEEEGRSLFPPRMLDND